MSYPGSWLLPLTVAFACGCASPTAEPSVTCDAAAAHVAACLETEVAPEAGATCDEAAAARVLDESCESIATSTGKADAWWCAYNPWLAGCGSTSEEPRAARLTGFVGFHYGLGIEPGSIGCALVELVDLESGEVRRTFSSSIGAFTLEDVAAGEYELRVLDRDEELAFARSGERAVWPITVDDDAHHALVLSRLADGTSTELAVGRTSEEAVSRCVAASFDLSLEDRCGDPIVPYLDSRFDWVVSVEDADGAISHASAYCQPRDGDHWAWEGCTGSATDITRASFGRLLPGTYRATAYRVDLPSRNNLDLAAELEWRRSDVIDLGEITIDLSEVDTGVTFEATLVDPRAGC